MNEPERHPTFTLAGHELALLPERAVFWPQRGWLFVADTHWGKCQTLRDAGAGVPSGPLMADLQRLKLLAERTNATRVVVLGDLVHSASSLAPGMDELVRRWRPTLDCAMALVPGNHDRTITGARGRGRLESWDIEPMEPVVETEGLRLLHHPPSAAGPDTLCGHVHPAIRMRGRGESLKLPCFWYEAQYHSLVLPAFSSFVDGGLIKAGPDDVIWAIAGRRVMPLPSPARSSSRRR